MQTRSLREVALAAGFLAASLLPSAVFAASSDNVVLTGSVTLNCSLTITAKPAATTMNLATSSTNLLVATVNENCQDRQGYTVTLTSNNGSQANVPSGLLASSGTNTDTVAYTVTYDGSAVTLVEGAATVTNATRKTGGSGTNKNLQISYTGQPSLSADTYTDTIVLALVGN